MVEIKGKQSGKFVWFLKRPVDLKIGKRGLTPEFLRECAKILGRDFMIKLGLPADKVLQNKLLNKFSQETSAQCIAKVGKTAAFIYQMNKPNPLQPGMKAPDFSTVDQDGKKYKNVSLFGVRYLLYFYPRDHTYGCTTEACALRDLSADFIKHHTMTLGSLRITQNHIANSSINTNFPFRFL